MSLTPGRRAPRPLYRDLDDAELDRAIEDLRALLWNASEIRDARGVFRLTRDLDIAVAIKRKRAQEKRGAGR